MQILNQPCIPRINPTWSWCMIFLFLKNIYTKIFFKLYFIVYALTVVPGFPPPLHLDPSHSLMQSPTVVHAHGSCRYVLWLLYSLCCTLHSRGYSVITNLYFLIPSPFSSVPLNPSHLAIVKMFSVSMILLLFWLNLKNEITNKHTSIFKNSPSNKK